MRFALLLLGVSAVGFAGNWSGYLVDSSCYAARQSNYSADASTTDRDMNMDIRYCSPTADTKKFAVVLHDWRRMKLDPAGNVRAAQLVRRHGGRRSIIAVNVGGVLRNKKTISVGSISALSVKPRR
jgi:hypothetical protein